MVIRRRLIAWAGGGVAAVMAGAGFVSWAPALAASAPMMASQDQVRTEKPFPVGRLFSNLPAVEAQYLGMSAATLRADRRAGESLATIESRQAAQHAGISLSGLEAVMTKTLSEDIQKAVSEHRLTSSEAATLQGRLSTMVARMVTATPPLKGPRGWLDYGLTEAEAQYLGMSAATLRADRRAGESLATIESRQAAQHAGISLSGLEAVMTKTLTANIQEAVSAHRLTSSEAATLQSRLSTMVARMVTATPPWGPHGKGPRGWMDHGLAEAEAQYLGMSAATLRADRRAGESLATIESRQAAQHAGISLSGLEAVMTKTLTEDIQKAVSEHRLTSSEAATLQGRLSTMVARMVTATPPPWGPHGKGPRGWMDHGLAEAEAQYLGMSAATLRADRRAGESLATIESRQAAQHAGISLSGLEAVMTKTLTANIQEAVSAHRLTSSEAATLQGRLSTMVARMVTATAPHPGGPHLK